MLTLRLASLQAQLLLCLSSGGGSTPGVDVEEVSFCHTITVAGAYGAIGDQIKEVRWFDTSTNPPTQTAQVFINENTGNIVTGVDATNSVPCSQPYDTIRITEQDCNGDPTGTVVNAMPTRQIGVMDVRVCGQAQQVSLRTFTLMLTNGVWVKPPDCKSFNWGVVLSNDPTDVVVDDSVNISNVGYVGLSGGHGVTKENELDVNGNAYSVTATINALVKIEYTII
jgi:hypothetical protein